MKTSKIKKNDLENNGGIKMIEEIKDDEFLLEKAEHAVISDLPERKKKKYQRDYGNRPENLRKPASQMTKDEKIQLKKWEISQLLGDDKEKQEPVYTEDDLHQAGTFILPFIAARLPVYRSPTEDEFSKFAKIHTPLANKYAAPYGQWKEEINGALFWLFFFMARISKTKEQENAES
jgi:hypothetical protein